MIKTGYSFCPNDTFLFYAWAHALVGVDCPIQPELHDVETLNEKALQNELLLSKLSFGALTALQDNYSFLPAGAALGWHCGPKLIALKPFSLEALSDKVIAIPGRQTTAHLLYNKLLPPARGKVFCRYDEINSLIKEGHVDAGLIIHESRFTFAQEGFVEIADLGELWHQKTGLALPLGCIALHKSVLHLAPSATRALQDSLCFAHSHKDAALPYILEHSLVKDPRVVQAHIALYVTPESYQLSSQGRAAIDLLLQT